MICGMLYLGCVAPDAAGLQTCRSLRIELSLWMSPITLRIERWAWESRGINTEHLPGLPCILLVSLYS